jgi:hypothetical protein
MNIKTKIMSFLLIFGVCVNSHSAEDVVIDNPYQCNNEELQRFIENKMEGMEKGLNSGESWLNFKIAYTEAKKESGDEECPLFWEDIELDGLMDGLDDIADFAIDPSSFFSVLGKTIMDRAKKMADAIIEQLSKGICERLSEDFIAKKLQEAGGEYVEDKYDLNIDFSDPDIMQQLLDETVCGAEGNNPLGGTLDGTLKNGDDFINKNTGTDIDFLAYGDESCDLFKAGSGDPDDPNEADDARADKAEEVVDKELDKLDAYLWD